MVLERRVQPSREAKTYESLLESRFDRRPDSFFLSEAQKQFILDNPEVYRAIGTNPCVLVSCYRGPSLRSPEAGLSIFYIFTRDVDAGEAAMWYLGNRCKTLSEVRSGGDYACDYPGGILDGFGFELAEIPSYAHCMNDMFSTEVVHTHDLSTHTGRLGLRFLYNFYRGEAIEGFAEYRNSYWWCRRACDYLSDQELLIFDGRLTPEERTVSTVTAKDLKAYNARIKRVRAALVLESQIKAAALRLDRDTGEMPEKLTRRIRQRLASGEIITAEHTAMHVEERVENSNFFEQQAAPIEPFQEAPEPEDTSGFGDDSGETPLTPLQMANIARLKKRRPGTKAQAIIRKQSRYIR